MKSVLRSKKGECNLLVENDLYLNNQDESILRSLPKIVPLYDGHELNINQKLIINELSTISVRNMRSKEFAIKKRNSFFNLHRPDLKGLNIFLGFNQQENKLQQHILKEVKTIHKIKTMKSLCKIDSQQNSSTKNQVQVSESNANRSGVTYLKEHSCQKNLKPVAEKTTLKNLVELSDMDLEELTFEDEKLSAHDMEIKSTVID